MIFKTKQTIRRLCYFIKLDATSLCDRVRVMNNDVPRDLEILDVSVSDDMKSFTFYTSNGLSKEFDGEADLGMKVRAAEYEDYRQYMYYSI